MTQTTKNATTTGTMNRKGAVLLYTTASLVAFAAIISLGVEFGHAQLAKTELQGAADAAARAGAGGLTLSADKKQLAFGDSMNDVGAVAASKQIAKLNKSDGKGINLLDGKV